MKEIVVMYDIGEEVENSFNGNKYMVVGYNWISGESVQYICIQSEKDEMVYLRGCELKGGVVGSIGFIYKDKDNGGF